MKHIYLATLAAVAIILAPAGVSAHSGQHKIKSGDTLSKIATEHNTDWQSLWRANPYIVNPNLIYIGNNITVPGSSRSQTPRAQCDEATQWVRADNGQCLDKPRPAVQPTRSQAREAVPRANRQAAPAPAPTPAPAPAPVRASGGPNQYVSGYCTWYVKERRPDIGGTWGNANQWVSSAQAAGYATGSVPRVGAIGVSFAGWGGHVVYVEGVSGGSVHVSEMNYAGFGVISTRTTSASEFTYIY